MRQKLCKICQSEDWLSKTILFLHHCEGLSYREIIERVKPYLQLSTYNLSTHFSRHLEQRDVQEIEELKERFEKEKQEASLEAKTENN